MALQLPPNFSNDIQGRDTALFPVVFIGGDLEEYISTNVWSFEGGHQTLPILLNIPSLKESIDIEKTRNYKISSLNIELNNYKYEGVRFSDRVGGSSLINKECRVFWASQSVTGIAFYDINIPNDPMLEDNPGRAFQVYHGIIRRYTHDDERAKLVVEDRSQEILHADLPRTNVGSGANVPDKYKNLNVPMVFGTVDRSPIIPHYSLSEEVDDNGANEVVNTLEFRLKADTEAVNFEVNEEIITIGNAEHTVSALYFFDNAAYHNVHKTNAPISQSGTEGGIANFTYGTTNDIVMDIDSSPYSTGPVNDMNDFAKGQLRVHTLRRFNKVETIKRGSFAPAILHIDSSGEKLGRIYGQMNLSTQATAGSSGSSPDFFHAYLKCYLEPMSVPSDLAVKADGTILPPITRLFKKIVHYNFNEDDDISPNAGSDDIPDKVNSAPLPDSTRLTTLWAAWSGDAYYVLWNSNGAFSEPHDTGQQSEATYNNINGQQWDDDIDLLDWFKTITQYDHINIGIPKHFYFHEGVSDLDSLSNWGVDTTIHNAFIVQTYFVMGITDKDYFANVRGRDNGQWTPHEIINNILINELNVPANEDGWISETLGDQAYAETNGGYLGTNGATTGTGMRYDFAVDKTINSKKLLEGLCSATPYIPRFDNMGNFRLDTIPKKGGVATATIEEVDCLSWSYNRTDIESVYTRIDFRYKWDYGRGAFSKRRILDADVFACLSKEPTPPIIFDETAMSVLNKAQCNMVCDDECVEQEDGVAWGCPQPDNYETYNYDYYGYDAMSGHKNTTLVVDDERGKYIRDDETAERFVCWLLSWYGQQHLKMKVRVPLKYIGIEVGDIIDFDKLLGNMAPYGIDYTRTLSAGVGDNYNPVQQYQAFYKNFQVFATNKTLEWIEIECIQLHELWSSKATENGVVNDVIVEIEPESVIGCSPVWGCTDPNACNYDEDAQLNNGTCYYPEYHCYDEDGDGTGTVAGGGMFCEGEAPAGFIQHNQMGACADDCVGTVSNPDPVDCFGVCNGTARLDNCGLCGDDWHSYAEQGNLDEWMDKHKDCAGICFGNAELDNCGNCIGEWSTEEPCVQDCAGVWGGDAELDECNVCEGDGSSCDVNIVLDGWNIKYPSVPGLSFGVRLQEGSLATGNTGKYTDLSVNCDNCPVMDIDTISTEDPVLKIAMMVGGNGATDNGGNVNVDVKLTFQIYINRTISASTPNGDLVTSDECENLYGTPDEPYGIELIGYFRANNAVNGRHVLQFRYADGFWYLFGTQVESLMPERINLFKDIHLVQGFTFDLNNTIDFDAVYNITIKVKDYEIIDYPVELEDANVNVSSYQLSDTIHDEFEIHHDPIPVDCVGVIGDATGDGTVSCVDYFLAQHWERFNMCPGEARCCNVMGYDSNPNNLTTEDVFLLLLEIVVGAGYVGLPYNYCSSAPPNEEPPPPPPHEGSTEG